jgi:hypothetical protein
VSRIGSWRVGLARIVELFAIGLAEEHVDDAKSDVAQDDPIVGRWLDADRWVRGPER